jgi:hypothetical protein
VTWVAAGPDTSRVSGNSQLRWWVLVLAAIAVSSSYYEDDVIGPIADLLPSAVARPLPPAREIKRVTTLVISAAASHHSSPTPLASWRTTLAAIRLLCISQNVAAAGSKYTSESGRKRSVVARNAPVELMFITRPIPVAPEAAKKRTIRLVDCLRPHRCSIKRPPHQEEAS